MSCQNTTKYEYNGAVRIQRTLPERWRDCTEGFGRVFGPCLKVLRCLFLSLLALAVLWSCWWIIVLVESCHKSPGLALEGMVLRDMAVYQNATNATTWLVRSDISFNLSTWNRNTVAGCHSTYRRMVVQAHFKDELILRQEVPLGFLLKPSRSRPVSFGVHGDGYPIAAQLASLLQVELRNASAVELQFLFETWYLRNDHKGGWMRMACDAIATTPSHDDPSYHKNSNGALVWSSCLAA